MFNKEKIKVTEENYKEIVLKRAIIVCWVILGICLVIKLFGGDFFNIVCKEENFVKFCDFIDNIVIKYIIYYLLFNLSMYLLLIIAIPSIKIKSIKFLIYLIIVNLTWIYKLLIELQIININMIVINIIDFSVYFIALSLLSRKPLRSFITMVLLFIFSLVSAVIKNIGLYGVITDSYLVATIFSIDYYIMLTLSALYSKKIYIRRLK